MDQFDALLFFVPKKRLIVILLAVKYSISFERLRDSKRQHTVYVLFSFFSLSGISSLGYKSLGSHAVVRQLFNKILNHKIFLFILYAIFSINNQIKVWAALSHLRYSLKSIWLSWPRKSTPKRCLSTYSKDSSLSLETSQSLNEFPIKPSVKLFISVKSRSPSLSLGVFNY